MLFSISWKNIWRKPSRSLVLITAIIIGLSGGVFSIAMTEGMMNERNDDVIKLNFSHIQVHNPVFDDYQKLKDSISNSQELVSQLKSTEEIKSFSSRLKFLGMMSSARSQQGVMIFGITPEEEKKVTDLYNCMLDSNSLYLGSGEENEILISSRIAQNLMMVYYQITDNDIMILEDKNVDKNVIQKIVKLKDLNVRTKNAFKDTLRNNLTSEQYDKYADILTDRCTKYSLGKKVILRFTDINGNLVEEAFKIVGIYKTTDAMYDNMNVFVRKEYLAKLLGVPVTTTTEIAIVLDDIKKIDIVADKLKPDFKGLSFKTYKDLDPMMMMQTDFMWIYYYIIIGFILFALSFGIVNTVLMSVVERTKELGMLMAIGMKKTKVFFMIMLESVMISLTGGILGMFVGGAVSIYFAKYGLDMTAYSGTWEAYGFNAIIHPQLKISFLLGITILVIIAGVLSSIYPAFRALKLNPSNALRTDA